MVDLELCTTSLTIAACANNKRGREMAEKSIDDYIATCERPCRRSALLLLKTNYELLSLETTLSGIISEIIDDRIARSPIERPENDRDIAVSGKC